MTAPVVLLVEDDFDLRETAAEVLAADGYQVACAVDGGHALELLRGGLRPFAILLDLMMPGMDGAGFRAAQLQDPTIAAIPVIVMSADQDASLAGRDLGAVQVLRKPTLLEDLLAALATLRTRADPGADPPG